MPEASFVLLHGGAHGGWCYQRVARILRARGYDVYTPTLTAYGEREHLNRDDLTMEDHVLDVANVIRYEDLHDVVLVGHSMGGVTIPLVAERVPDRIRRVVWHAGVVLANGESIVTDYTGPTPQVVKASQTLAPEDFVEAFMQDGTPADKKWLAERFGPTSMPTLTHVGDLDRFLALGLPTGFVACVLDQAVSMDQAREHHARLGEGSRWAEVNASHNSMISAPEETADAFEAMV
jgi:pimeloyl-ACP methyl ester carboxylesterase